MWKTIVLCVSLFGVAAAGLTLGARWLEPAALPLAAAIGLCVIGVVLILAAPTAEAAGGRAAASATPTLLGPPPIDLTPAEKRVSNQTPPLPFEALNP